MSQAKAVRRVGRQLGFDAEDAGVGAQRLDRGADPGCQAATADRDKHVVRPSGRSSAISRPMVPCPAMMSGWSNGGTSTPPVAATSSAATFSRWPAPHNTTSRAVAAGGGHLDAGVSSGMTMCAGTPYTAAAYATAWA